VVPLNLYVRLKVREDFGRARTIASRKAGYHLTRGATFEVVVDDYLDRYDPDRVKPGSRKVPPTEGVPGRYVPADVRREVRSRRSEGSASPSRAAPAVGPERSVARELTRERCQVPLCENYVYLELAHVVAHARGGDREANNLVLLCHEHHRMLDAGLMRMVGPADAPRFLDRDGNEIGQRFGPVPLGQATAESGAQALPPAGEVRPATPGTGPPPPGG
jgi:hypothetical protein